MSDVLCIRTWNLRTERFSFSVFLIRAEDRFWPHALMIQLLTRDDRLRIWSLGKLVPHG